MLESIVVVLLIGLAISSQPRMGFGNPFQIYFAIWFVIFFGYMLSMGSFIGVSSEFLLLMLAAKTLALFLLIATYFYSAESRNVDFASTITLPNRWLLLTSQIIVVAAIPFAYQKALSLAGGSSVFSIVGYRNMRHSMIYDGQGIGVISYFFILSYVVSSIALVSYKFNQIGKVRLLALIAVSLFYAYLTTGRTSVLQLMLLLVIPLLLLKTVNVKGAIVFFILLLSLFFGVAMMTSKGVSSEASFIENVYSFANFLRSYTIAPTLAFFQLTESSPPIDWGGNMFRFFVAVANAVGLADSAPVELVKDFAYVPDPTNVYTVYGVYFRDFSYFGVAIPPLFLIAHWFIYQKSRHYGGVWIFYYAASVYPLTLQFFQDQYFSLLSIWIQLAVWYWIFLSLPKVRLFVGAARHD